MWLPELLVNLGELVELVDLIALILKGVGALTMLLVRAVCGTGQFLIEGTRRLLRPGA